MTTRRHITAALTADARQDLFLARYAEHGHLDDLAAAIDTAYEILEALMAESKRTQTPSDQEGIF